MRPPLQGDTHDASRQAKHRCLHNTVTAGQLVSVVAGRNLSWLGSGIPGPNEECGRPGCSGTGCCQIYVTNRSRFVPVEEALSRIVPDSNRRVILSIRHDNTHANNYLLCEQYLKPLSMTRADCSIGPVYPVAESSLIVPFFEIRQGLTNLKRLSMGSVEHQVGQAIRVSLLAEQIFHKAMWVVNE